MKTKMRDLKISMLSSAAPLCHSSVTEIMITISNIKEGVVSMHVRLLHLYLPITAYAN
jgi:hypothetical protein